MTQTNDHWLLPEGIEELLPEQAQLVERLRRSVLDCYDRWGYELVMPPFVEYLDSLLTGTGADLDLQTFKVTDPLTGRLMGIRADMTPQAARIDAHQLQREAPVRLCYLGTVLHTRPEGFTRSRAPLQIGAELYGHGGIESDLEILELMLETLRLMGISEVYVDLGHVGIFRNLARWARLAPEAETILFEALQRKAVPEISTLLAGLHLSAVQRNALQALAGLHGGPEVFEQARALFAQAGAAVNQSLDELAGLADAVARRQPQLALHFDLAELRGYNYQNGIVFAAFVPGHGQELARGGRYDGIGRVFGRDRPATGFSTDLKTLVECSTALPAPPVRRVIYAPADDGLAGLSAAVAALRAQGDRVIHCLPGQAGDAQAMGCTHELRRQQDQWVAVELAIS